MVHSEGRRTRNGLQCKYQVFRRLKPVLRLLLNAVTDDILISSGNGSLIEIRSCRLLPQNGCHSVDFGFSMKGPLARKQLIKDRAKAEDVASVIDRLAPKLFGRHVGHRADHRSVLGNGGQAFEATLFLSRELKLGHAEIENLDAVVVGEKQIFWL